MNLLEIERLIAMFARALIAELELSEAGWRIRLTRAGASADPATPTGEAPRHAAAAPEPAPEVVTQVDDAHRVVAGLVGTFYRRPAPDKPPFVEVGDVVEEGQTLGIMEAMKMLIGVEADRAGRISAILAEDGAAMQPGEPLFAIVPTAP